MLVNLQIVYGCFRATVSQLSDCDRNNVAWNVFSLALQNKFRPNSLKTTRLLPLMTDYAVLASHSGIYN